MLIVLPTGRTICRLFVFFFVLEYIMPTKRPPTLYHISFVEKTDSVWMPKLPDGMEENKVSKKSSTYPEPAFERICCSESLEGCFMAVYPNVSMYFEDKKYNYPYLDFYYYTPTITSKIKDSELLAPDELTKNHYVWDAHLTREWDILVPVNMVLAGKIRFHNTSKEKEWITTHPFDNEVNAVRNVCPPIEMERLHYTIKPISAKW